MKQFANALNLKEMHQTPVTRSPLPMPAGALPSPWFFVLLICYFSLYVSSLQFTVWFSRPKSVSVNNVFLEICFFSNDSAQNSTPRIKFPKSSSHLMQLSHKRPSAHITALPSPATLKGTNSKRHTSEEKLKFFH